MLNNLISQKIKISSFFLIMMVVYIHSYNIKNDSVYLFVPVGYISTINIYFQNLISEGIARISVPFFFIISGYLFFKEKTLNMTLYKKKLTNRIFTLLIPYIFWSSFVVLIYFILQSIPITTHYFNSSLVRDLSNKELLNKIFIEPINYPLWFIRDLIFLVLLSPLFYVFIRYSYIAFFIVLIILWSMGINQGAEFHLFKSEPFLFFAIGVYFGMRGEHFIKYKISNNSLTIIVLIYLFIILLKTYFYTFNIYPYLIIFMHKVSILIGIFTFWHLLDRIIISKFIKLSTYSFLFYVFHEPMMTIIKKGIYSILGKSPEVSLLLYIFTPIIIVSILILLFYFFQKYFPTFFSTITGGRIS